jgi:glycerophosphoryl diester phosphodiesterase
MRPPLPPLVLRAAGRAGRPLASAHRGALLEAPENTLPAFERACALGADLIEFDVRQTGDGQLVVIHDASLDRTTDGRGAVSDQAAAAIRRLDAGGWFGPAFAGTPVPTLAEALACLHGRGYACVELKQEPAARLPDLVAPVAAALVAAGMVEHTLVLAYDHPALLALKARLPTVRAAVGYGGRVVDPVAVARAARADAVWMAPDFLLPDDVASLHAAGLAVGCPARSRDEASRLRACGVDIIGLDDIGGLVGLLAPA